MKASFLEAFIFTLHKSVCGIPRYCDDIAYLNPQSISCLKENIYQSSKQMAANTEDRFDWSEDTSAYKVVLMS